MSNVSVKILLSERRYVLLDRLAEADGFAIRPRDFADRLGDRMDAFSQILSGVKLNGAVFFSAEFSAPWGFSTAPSDKIAAELAPGVAHLVLYHFVIDGGALVRIHQSGKISPRKSATLRPS